MWCLCVYSFIIITKVLLPPSRNLSSAKTFLEPHTNTTKMDRKSVVSLALICIVFAAGVGGQSAPTTSPASGIEVEKANTCVVGRPNLSCCFMNCLHQHLIFIN